MSQHRVVWLTQRGERHQQKALQTAPAELDVSIYRNPHPDVLNAALSTAEFLISERRGFIGQAIVDAAPSLKLVVRLGSLVDDIDRIALQKAGIRLSRQPIPGCIYVAEHCLMMMLALYKNLKLAQYRLQTVQSKRQSVRTDENTFSYNWTDMKVVRGLHGQRIAIVGMGEIGVELTRRLQSFGPAVVRYHKRQPYAPEVERELGIFYTPALMDAISQADILVNLLPYSPVTDQIINADILAKIPSGALLVHAGSGSTIDEAALMAALQSGQLGGAALDTFEYEPLPFNHLLRNLAADPAINLILTPHIAATTIPQDRARDYDEILRFLSGERLHHEVHL